MSENQKSDASNKSVIAFCEWLQGQDYNTQRDIIRHAKKSHGYVASRQALMDDLRHNFDHKEAAVRKMAKVMFIALLKPDIFDQLALKKDAIPDHVTADEAAAILGMSRATFFRKAEDARFRESLEYSGTNSRNGRYSLERVIDIILHNAFLVAELEARLASLKK